MKQSLLFVLLASSVLQLALSYGPAISALTQCEAAPMPRQTQDGNADR